MFYDVPSDWYSSSQTIAWGSSIGNGERVFQMQIIRLFNDLLSSIVIRTVPHMPLHEVHQ